MAGSSKNTQPCRFVVIDDAAVKDAIAKCGDFATWIPATPLLIAVAVSNQSKRAEFDAGRAAQNMMVAAWADGVSSCPTTMHRVEDAAVIRALAACGQYTEHLPYAPLVIALVMPADGWDFDAGRAAQNMMLAAWEEGITSCPTSMYDMEAARQVLRVPEGYRIAIVLPFAFPPPSGIKSRGLARISLQDVVHRGGW